MADNIAGLVFDLSLKTAELTKGITETKNQLGGLNKTFDNFKSAITGAFTLTAVVAFSRGLFELGSEMDDLGGKLDDLGFSINQALNGGKVKAIADAFDVDFNGVLESAAAVSKNFGISLGDALNYIENGLSLAGPQSDKFLKSIRDQSASFAGLQGSADNFFSIVTNGYRSQTEFEKELAKGTEAHTEAFAKLVEQENDGQKIQLALIDSSSRWNSILIQLFDGTNDRADTFKTTLYNIGSDALVAIVDGVIDVSNYFIQLYNKAALFRVLIQAIVVNFQTLYNAVKSVFQLFYDFFETSGNLISAILKGDVSEIPGIVKQGIAQAKDQLVDNAKNIYNDFKDAIENVAHNNPIALIVKPDFDKREVENVKKNLNSAVGGSPFTAPDSKQSQIKGVAVGGITFPKELQTPAYTQQVLKLASAWEILGDSIKDNIQDNAVSAIESLGNTLAANVQQGITSLKDFGNAFLTTAKQVISASLAQSIAEAILASSDIPFPGNIIAAGVAVGAVTSLFASIPKFENGGFVGSSLIRMNESGGELANLPNGSLVVPSRLSSQLIGGISSSRSAQQVVVTGVLRGNDLYLQQQETIRKRNLAN